METCPQVDQCNIVTNRPGNVSLKNRMTRFSSHVFVVGILICFRTGYTNNIFVLMKSTRLNELDSMFFLKKTKYGKLGNRRFGKEIPDEPILTPMISARQPWRQYAKRSAKNTWIISSEEKTININIVFKIIIHPPHAIQERAYNSPLLLSNGPARFQIRIVIRSQTGRSSQEPNRPKSIPN